MIKTKDGFMKEIDFDSEEVQEQIRASADEFVDNLIKKRNIVLSDEYLRWVGDCVDRYGGHISDDDFLYKEKSIDRDNSMLLSYLLSEVSSLAEDQRVLSVTDKENPFESERYTVKIFDRFFEMSNMIGQGSITFIESCNKPDHCYVTLKS